MSRKNKTSQCQKTWRDVPDRLHRTFPSLPHPLSLYPDVSLMDRYVSGDEEARIILDAWSFSFPVTRRQYD